MKLNQKKKDSHSQDKNIKKKNKDRPFMRMRRQKQVPCICTEFVLILEHKVIDNTITEKGGMMQQDGMATKDRADQDLIF